MRDCWNSVASWSATAAPSDRRDYYRVPPDLFRHTMAQRLERWQRFHEAIGEARTKLANTEPQGPQAAGGVRFGVHVPDQAIREAPGTLERDNREQSPLAGSSAVTRPLRGFGRWVRYRHASPVPARRLVGGVAGVAAVTQSSWIPPPSNAPENRRFTPRCLRDLGARIRSSRWPRWWTSGFGTIPATRLSWANARRPRQRTDPNGGLSPHHGWRR